MDGELAFVDEGVEGRVGVSLGVEAHGFEDLAQGNLILFCDFGIFLYIGDDLKGFRGQRKTGLVGGITHAVDTFHDLLEPGVADGFIVGRFYYDDSVGMGRGPCAVAPLKLILLQGFTVFQGGGVVDEDFSYYLPVFLLEVHAIGIAVVAIGILLLRWQEEGVDVFASGDIYGDSAVVIVFGVQQYLGIAALVFAAFDCIGFMIVLVKSPLRFLYEIDSVFGDCEPVYVVLSGLDACLGVFLQEVGGGDFSIGAVDDGIEGRLDVRLRHCRQRDDGKNEAEKPNG